MTPEKFLDFLLLASNAKTDEDKARVAWRASDAMWRDMTTWGIGFCRAFNNLLQDQDWPWAENLWTADERKLFVASLVR